MSCACQTLVKSTLAATAILTLVAATASAADGLWTDQEIPHRGEILPGSPKLEQVDRLMNQILARHEVPGAGVAITYEGRLILARGYGWADIETQQAVRPETLFGLASVSKPITAITVLKLVEQGRLKLDDRVFELLGGPKAPPGHTVDPRLRRITLRMLLHHTGGWDRSKSGDPSGFSEKAARELHVKLPLTIDQLIYYMNGVPLDFDPGTEERYSNYGFMLLGRVIQRVTGEPYAKAVRKLTLTPMDMRTIRMSVVRRPGAGPFYLRGEAKRYFIGDPKSLESGILEMTGAAGGWCDSAVEMARFLTAVDGTRTDKPFLDERIMRQMLAKPEPPLRIRRNGSWFGAGWDTVREIPDWPHGEGLAYGKNGALPGISTWAEHLPGGVDWVVLFNGTVRKKPKTEAKTEATVGLNDARTDEPKISALTDVRKKMVKLLRGVKRWPQGDLFAKFR